MHFISPSEMPQTAQTSKINGNDPECPVFIGFSVYQGFNYHRRHYKVER